ncbi:hypothetical protein FB45DRAFT_819398 [Roridomyces roridus]|uniref:Uncharacterized protein n=1 Tax=Roridomyces roridus TaxID=1738132 RepID=A0AAD7FYP6_9AGAR|nr:hypothetical protein FB45DRAFT_819398 [Roridomyces roridus]
MEDLNTPGEPDGLFFERLDAFCHAEIKAFAERERRPLEERCMLNYYRKYVAEWHSRYLFQPRDSPQDRIARGQSILQSVLTDASRMLESLCETSGVHSFLLAVDSTDASSSGFLGGSVVGREFWRGQRGGGEAGAKAFKIHCAKNAEASSPAPKASTSRSVKTELYEGVRKALRSASGVRNAEMKWTNPGLLSTYGVCLVGWPPTIPAQNPSSLKANQNKELLDALENGTMHFVRTLVTPNEPPPPVEAPPAVEDSSFSWAIEYDPVPDDDRPAKRARTSDV